MKPSEKLWRTLIRVSDVDHADGFFHVILPGWDSRAKVRLDLKEVPDEIRRLVKPDKRFHARVNIGAESKSDLRFDDWESE